MSHRVIQSYKEVQSPSSYNTWSDNKDRELFTIKVLHTSLLNTTMVAFKIIPLEAMH